MKKKHPLNILKYGYIRGWRPFAIRNNIRQFFYNIKYVYQRIVWGFSEYDTFNLDYYYAELFYNSLTYFSENLHSYPMPFDSVEDWKKYLTKMAAHFYNSIEDNEGVWTTEKTENAFDYYNSITETKLQLVADGLHQLKVVPKDGYTEEDIEKARKEWMDAESLATKFRTGEAHRGLSMLDEVFFNLWD